MSKKKILFVCTVNRMRSATAQEIYKNDSRFEVKSAGIDPLANTVLSEILLGWADAVVVMEDLHRDFIRRNFPEVYNNKKIVCLEIPDHYYFMDPDLIELLKQKFEEVYEEEL